MDVYVYIYTRTHAHARRYSEVENEQILKINNTPVRDMRTILSGIIAARKAGHDVIIETKYEQAVFDCSTELDTRGGIANSYSLPVAQFGFAPEGLTEGERELHRQFIHSSAHA